MAEPGTLCGGRGRVTWAYHVAAEVTGFTLTVDKKTLGGTLVGTVHDANPVFLRQTPLTFVMRSCRWPVESIRVEGASLVARLGPLQQRTP